MAKINYQPRVNARSLLSINKHIAQTFVRGSPSSLYIPQLTHLKYIIVSPPCKYTQYDTAQTVTKTAPETFYNILNHFYRLSVLHAFSYK